MAPSAFAQPANFAADYPVHSSAAGAGSNLAAAAARLPNDCQCRLPPPGQAQPSLQIATKMDFRRSGQLDERRRRVLRDELAQPTDNEAADSPAGAAGSAKGPVRAYCPAVLAERQPRVTDLVPLRPLWMAVAILLAVTAVAAIECLHIHARALPLAGAPQLAALDAAERGSVAAWFSSLLLAGGACLALVAFGIRRHRVDDYRGQYRIWLWATAALAFASLDAATGIHDSLGLALVVLAGQSQAAGSLAAATTLSWLALFGLAFGTLGIRLAIEVWCSTASLAALAMAGLLYLIGSLLVLDVWPATSPLVASVIQTSIVQLAHVALVSAVALYARHVALDAAGRLKVHIDPDKKKPAKKARTRLKVVKSDEDETPKPPAAKSAAREPVKFQASPPSGPLAAKTAAALARSTATSSHDDDEEDDDHDEGGERLSRAERRRLKKLARREGQRRAA